MERDLVAAANDRQLALSQAESESAVSWPAVFAGAVTSLALSFVLLTLAAGFGLRLSAMSGSPPPMSDSFTPILGAWAITIQVLSSALGGYLAGRLRTKWLNVHSHEVHFRDTAHGLLVWALSTVAALILAATVLEPAGLRAGDVAAESAAVSAAEAGPSPQVIGPDTVADATPSPAQIQRAENIAAQASFFLGVGLLLSAFTASVAAAIGGLRRDEMHAKHWANP